MDHGYMSPFSIFELNYLQPYVPESTLSMPIIHPQPRIPEMARAGAMTALKTP